ncbi:sugar MFS transporter [Granulicella sibirica]|uniref:Putative mannose transporter, GGP family n=1 Tax=Granulicella sibirica TaxID=2479048 RepID=A0A4Q0SY55_9BACT|nr:sugar MFS transporter [Granulicella sibirica]RXH56143.1 putative mannose transporter, GGP family [Granulicella sibirica]
MAIANPQGTRISSYTPNETNYSAMAMVSTLFFMWGFCTVLNDVLIPHLQTIFALSYVQASLIQLAFFSSYFIFAQPAGKLVEVVGYQRSMVIGLITMGVGALLFIPAATTVTYALFLAAQVVLAAGVTVLQVAANPYVTILGPPETASSRLNLTQAFNTLGDTVAPWFGSILILGGTAAAVKHAAAVHGAELTRAQQAASVKLPYYVLAGILILLAVAIALYKFPRLEVTKDFRPGELGGGKGDSVWNHPHLYLGAIAIFIYVGAEVSIGSFLVKYLADPTIAGLSLEAGAKLVAFYWGGMMVGRFIGSALMQKISAPKLLVLSGVGAAVLVGCSLFGTGQFAEVTILAVGLFNSIMFPTIFTLAVAELGPLTGRGSGLVVQGIVGGAVIPVFMGYCADHYGIHRSLLLPFVCYFFIIFYGLRGYRISPSEPTSHLEAVPGS